MRPQGLYCPAGDFHIDPCRPVETAVITHAHGDHARRGNARVFAAAPGLGVMRERLGRAAAIEAVAYGQPFTLGAARVSLHPAGHILGSSQVRVEVDGEVWVVSGDYKRDADPSCTSFEVVPCDTFITEATFASPVYRWPPAGTVAAEIARWWRSCAEAGETAVLFCYALGKAQRVLAELAALPDQNPREIVYLHAAMTGLVKAYRQAGVVMLPTEAVAAQVKVFNWAGKLVIAPPGAGGTPWMKRFRPFSTGFASGWMQIPEHPRRRGYDRGFVLSDHADWDSLLLTIAQTGARRVLVMHGRSDALIAALRARGLQADELAGAFAGETEDAGDR